MNSYLHILSSLYTEAGVFGVFIKEMSSDLYSLLAVPGVVGVFIELVIGRFGVLSIWKKINCK